MPLRIRGAGLLADCLRRYSPALGPSNSRKSIGEILAFICQFTFGSHLARVSFPSVCCDWTSGVEIWALVVSPSNRSLHKCHRAEHEPATARLKTALPQSWFQISSGDLHTTTDACKRARETRAAARVTQNFRGCLARPRC